MGARACARHLCSYSVDFVMKRGCFAANCDMRNKKTPRPCRGVFCDADGLPPSFFRRSADSSNSGLKYACFNAPSAEKNQMTISKSAREDIAAPCRPAKFAVHNTLCRKTALKIEIRFFLCRPATSGFCSTGTMETHDLSFGKSRYTGICFPNKMRFAPLTQRARSRYT